VNASGNDANKTFIENGRFHGDLIARSLTRDRSAHEETAAAGAARH